MVRSMMIFAGLTAAVSAHAASGTCARFPLLIHDVGFTAEGMIARQIFIRKVSDSQNSSQGVKYIPVVRDQIQLQEGDEITLNAAPQMQDAMVQVKASLIKQNRDEQGILSSTFMVTEIMTSLFSGEPVKSEKTYRAKIFSNYVGKGVYSKGCSKAVKSEIIVGATSDESEAPAQE